MAGGSCVGPGRMVEEASVGWGFNEVGLGRLVA